jgi:hypothetical protein
MNEVDAGRDRATPLFALFRLHAQFALSAYEEEANVRHRLEEGGSSQSARGWWNGRGGH